MKKVLLLGDSIRMSYQARVKELLSGTADVVGPEENCRFAKYTLWSLKDWLVDLGTPDADPARDGRFDVIHWNNGIWDIFHRSPEMGIFTPLDEYIRDLGRILTELRKTRAVILWASTTAVDGRNPTCNNADIDRYNEAAAELMRREGVTINDLNAVTKRNVGEYISEDLLHLSQKGMEACAEAVAGMIRRNI